MGDENQCILSWRNIFSFMVRFENVSIQNSFRENDLGYDFNFSVVIPYDNISVLLLGEHKTNKNCKQIQNIT